MSVIIYQLNNHKFYSIIIIIIAITNSIINIDCLIRKKRIVGGWKSAQPPEDDPVVFINKNNRDSRIYGKRDENKGFYVFKGIRFGEPPIGRNRFQRARAVHVDGEYNATRWASPCPQKHNGKIIGSEDCLFLNVFTPQLPDSLDGGYPVLIWIHGGGFKIGAACQYEMRNLIKKKMIVVSIQYRLGSLGFLSVGDPDLPGNNGLFDMLLAVNWVKQYIEYFGGNPNKLVAFGHGTGASAALILSLSKLTNNFFNGLIAMSGSLLSNFVIDKKPMSTSKKIATDNGCPIDNITNMIHCLQELPIEMIINADSNIANIRIAAQGFLSGITGLLVPGPVIEGNDDMRSLPNFMTDSPENYLTLDKFPNIPLLTGVMKDESGGAINGGYSDKILMKLKSMPDFVNKELLDNLQNAIPIIGNATQQFIPQAFGKYFNSDNTNNNIGSTLKNVAKAINDAIFNVPAYLTINYWRKKAKAYFYSFDYISKKSRKNNYLNGLPIVDERNSQKDNYQGHGDDLTYIFGQGNDIFGNKIQDNGDDDDDDDDDDDENEQVSEIFTDMIAQFARTGIIGDNSTSNIDKSSIYSNDDNTFLSITDKIQPMKNFKFCEMALWTGAIDQLSSSYCDSIRVTVETIARLKDKTDTIINLTNSSIDTIINLPNINGKGILTNSTSKIPKIPSIPGLGLFG